MVNKDQLDQTPEGKEVLALMAKHFIAEQFQPALTLIEQRYTEEQPVWDADLNSDSKLPFLKTTPAHRLLVFFASPSHVAQIKAELKQHAAEVAIHAAESQAGQPPVATRPKVKRKTKPRASKKEELRRRQQSKSPTKRSKRKSRSSKAKKSRAKKH